MKTKFTWGWCNFCKCQYVRCYACGNNCCNGGYGEVNGKKCKVCPEAYDYQNKCYKEKTVPKKKDCFQNPKISIKDWLKTL